MLEPLQGDSNCVNSLPIERSSIRLKRIPLSIVKKHCIIGFKIFKFVTLGRRFKIPQNPVKKGLPVKIIEIVNFNV